MSTSDLYILNKRTTRHVAEFRNGYGSGPRAWDHLSDKYIAEKPVYSLNPDHMNKVWALATDPRVELYERVVLMMTFERSYVPLSHLEEAANACERFGVECEDNLSVNHWPEIGAELWRVSTMKHSRFTRGVCLSCTSVMDCWLRPVQDWAEGAWSIYKAG